MADGNPRSFLRVSRAELELPKAPIPTRAPCTTRDSEFFRAARVVARSRRRTECVCVSAAEGGHTQTGLAACFSLDEYDRDVIRKHERTRRDKEDDRTRHMIALGAQTGPVFLTYRAQAEVNDITRRATSSPRGAPLFDFEAVDGVQHTIGAWAAPIATRWSRRSRAFRRCTSPMAIIVPRALRARETRCARADCRATRSVTAPMPRRFSAVAFPHDEVQILPYNRVRQGSRRALAG